MRIRLLGITAVVLAACTGNAAPVTTAAPASTPASTTVAPTTSTTAVLPTTTTAPTTTPPAEAPSWPAATAERQVESFLSALAAGAFEQAGWRLDNEGGAYEGQRTGETARDFLERICAGDRCTGPYRIVATTPADTGLPAWALTIEHEASGDTAVVTVVDFGGQLVVAGLPPLVAGAGQAAPLVESLFGADPPDRVVVARYDAFEIWDGTEVRWVTNWFAGADWLQVEAGFLAAGSIVAPLDDPTAPYEYDCPTLIDRDGTVLVRERCVAAGDTLTEIETGQPVSSPEVALPDTGCETIGWYERGGVTVGYASDAEGNLCVAVNAFGRVVIGDDYPGITVLSTDGRWFVYGDQRDQGSAHWTNVVVARSTGDGSEIGRWTLDGIVTCLEASAEWILVCQADPDDVIGGGDVHHDALVAINIATGEIRRVATRALVFLPA